RSFVRQIHAILRGRKSSAGFAHDDDAGWRKRTAKFQNHTGSDRFVTTAGVGMEDDESGKSIEPRWLVPSGNRKTQILVQGHTECATFATWDDVYLIDVANYAQQRRSFRIDDPCNFRLGISITNRRDRWKSVNYIPERTRFDDQGFRRHELATERQTVGEQTRQPGGDNFFAGLFDGVANTALLDQIFVGVVNSIGGPRI